MTLPNWCAKLRGTRSVGKGIFLACLLAITLVLYQQVTEKKVNLIIDGDMQVVLTRAKTVGQLLEENGLYVRNSDILQPDAQDRVVTGMQIHLQRAVPVFVHYDGQTRLVYTTAANAAELFTELGLTLSLHDRIEPDLNCTLVYGQSVYITRITSSLVHEEVAIPFSTEKKSDVSLASGKQKVLVQGKTGTLQKTFQVTYADGEEETRHLTEEKQLEAPVNRVVLIGTGEPPPVITASSRGGQVVEAYEGVASWYGDKFQGAKTASGEIFNKNDFTAAHPTLAFGTRVRVTFLKTGRSVEVRITDRGPFGKNRIIDLSMAAAEAIGLRSAGIGTVRIEVLR